MQGYHESTDRISFAGYYLKVACGTFIARCIDMIVKEVN